MKVVIGTPFLGENFVNDLREEFPQAQLVAAYKPEDLRREIVDAEVCMGWPDREAFRAARKLKWVHAPGMGIDRMAELPELKQSGATITNSPGPHENPMADHVLAVVLIFAHRLREMIEDQRAKVWDTRKYTARIADLSGTVMGLLSMGGIGRAVARRALAFGMEVYAVDPNPLEAPAGVRAVWDMDRLGELLGMSDWLVITSPLLPATKRLIDGERMAQMKRGSHLIVISRGGIVDEDALVAALRSGHLAGAALDATAVEPLPKDSPLWEMENVIISPHASALSEGMYEGRRRIFRANLRRFINGEALAHVCDLERGY